MDIPYLHWKFVKMNRKQCIPVACIVCALTLLIYTCISIDNHVSHVIKRLCDEGGDRLGFVPLTNPPRTDITKYIKQRNDLSRLLNQKQKMYAQKECEVGAIRANDLIFP